VAVFDGRYETADKPLQQFRVFFPFEFDEECKKEMEKKRKLDASLMKEVLRDHSKRRRRKRRDQERDEDFDDFDLVGGLPERDVFSKGRNHQEVENHEKGRKGESLNESRFRDRAAERRRGLLKGVEAVLHATEYAEILGTSSELGNMKKGLDFQELALRRADIKQSEKSLEKLNAEETPEAESFKEVVRECLKRGSQIPFRSSAACKMFQLGAAVYQFDGESRIPRIVPKTAEDFELIRVVPWARNYFNRRATISEVAKCDKDSIDDDIFNDVEEYKPDFGKILEKK